MGWCVLSVSSDDVDAERTTLLKRQRMRETFVVVVVGFI